MRKEIDEPEKARPTGRPSQCAGKTTPHLTSWYSTSMSAAATAGRAHVTPQVLINVINANDRISRVKPADTRQT
jgi:hypothetical protein